MDYTKFSREELIERIEELEKLNYEFQMEREQEIRLDYTWTGNLGHWYWDIKTNKQSYI